MVQRTHQIFNYGTELFSRLVSEVGDIIQHKYCKVWKDLEVRNTAAWSLPVQNGIHSRTSLGRMRWDKTSWMSAKSVRDVSPNPLINFKNSRCLCTRLFTRSASAEEIIRMYCTITGWHYGDCLFTASPQTPTRTETGPEVRKVRRALLWTCYTRHVYQEQAPGVSRGYLMR